MNYRHIYHAGNRCDVVKHAVLIVVMQHLAQKMKGFAMLDTHAGAGLYDLCDERAVKTNEASLGIKALLNAPPIPTLETYYKILRKLNPLWGGQDADGFRFYPGSPLLAFYMLRQQDRVVACELHPEDAESLRLNAPADSRLQLHSRDGYEALTAFVPPVEKRGFVLIDPPFEQPDEYKHIIRRFTQAYRRWPTGTYIFWYPIKDRPAIWQFHDALISTGIPKILAAEFAYEENVRTNQLGGGGLILVNPPWKLDDELRQLFPELHKAMASPYSGTNIRWLVSD